MYRGQMRVVVGHVARLAAIAAGLWAACACTSSVEAGQPPGDPPRLGGARGADTDGSADPSEAGSARDGHQTPDSGALAEPPPADCVPEVSDYRQRGPFSLDAHQIGDVHLWVPRMATDCRAPVIHLSNGTAGNCAIYAPILEHLASYGFLAACYDAPNTGSGAECMAALDTAFQAFPDRADDRIGSTGHSQGGGGALLCVQQAEQAWGETKRYAGHAIEPAHGFPGHDYLPAYAQIRSPIFMFNGSLDMFVSADVVGNGFYALPEGVEAYWYEAQGAMHFPVPLEWAKESALAWFRWRLLGDAGACRYFMAMPTSSQWSEQAVRTESDC